MSKFKFIIPILLLVSLVLVGAECGEESKGKKVKIEEMGYDEEGNRILLEEPELECWPIGSEVGPWDSSEEEVTTIFGVDAIQKCKSLECKTPEGMEWMTVVNYFKDKMEPLGWEKDSGQNIYYSDWQTFTVWYFGYNKKKQQGYKLEYCDVIPKKDLE